MVQGAGSLRAKKIVRLDVFAQEIVEDFEAALEQFRETAADLVCTSLQIELIEAGYSFRFPLVRSCSWKNAATWKKRLRNRLGILADA
jgi:hypothetical protein